MRSPVPGEEGISLAELAAALGGTAEGEARVYIAAGLDDAVPGSVVRVEHPRYLAAAEAGPAAALLVPPDLTGVSRPCIRVAGVRLAFARCLELFAPRESHPDGVHSTASLGEEVALGDGCAVGPYAVIGRGVVLGPRTVVHAHAVLMDGVVTGEDCVVFPHAVLYPRTCLGSRVRIHAGAVIGADGYGYEWSGECHQKIPQLGRVRLEDEVEVGANTTIDRATTGETVLGAGTKVDNLVQIGHNVRTGRHCLIVAQVGIAGSTTLGDGVVLAGQAGLKDHIEVGDRATIIAGAGVWGDVPAGTVISGNPGRPHREELRIHAMLHKLPELLRRVTRLERRLPPEASSEGETPGDG